MQAALPAVEISMEDTDTLQEYYQPTNDISEEALTLIKAWEASFSNPINFAQRPEHDIGTDCNIPSDLSQPPQRYHRSPRKILKMN
jgi:hypothetical protein